MYYIGASNMLPRGTARIGKFCSFRWGRLWWLVWLDGDKVFTHRNGREVILSARFGPVEKPLRLVWGFLQDKLCVNSGSPRKETRLKGHNVNKGNNRKKKECSNYTTSRDERYTNRTVTNGERSVRWWWWCRVCLAVCCTCMSSVAGSVSVLKCAREPKLSGADQCFAFCKGFPRTSKLWVKKREKVKFYCRGWIISRNTWNCESFHITELIWHM